jgi:cytidylate kinase
LRKAEDAIELDNTKLSEKEQFQKALHWAQQQIHQPVE